LQWDANGPMLGRYDTGTVVTSGSDRVTDTKIMTTDQGKSVLGTGIPPGTFVGTVTAGASFLLSSSATSQVNVSATGNGNGTVVIAPPNPPDNDTHTLYDTSGTPYVGENTAVTTGEIPTPVTNFNWVDYSINGSGGTLLTLPAGTYNAGIACVTDIGTTDRFWNSQLTFKASGDPNGESWTINPVLTCTGGSGTGTLSPGLTATPTQQTISGTDNLTGCSGSGTITGGTVTTSRLKTLATGNPPQQASCAELNTPPPKGTVVASGTGSILWSDGSTSAGSIKLKSTGAVGTETETIKITSGQFFVAGHITKAKGTISFHPATGQNCPTLTQVNATNATTTITET
jgi:hypothetical protein